MEQGQNYDGPSKQTRDRNNRPHQRVGRESDHDGIVSANIKRQIRKQGQRPGSARGEHR
jgi:hypothetical protein